MNLCKLHITENEWDEMKNKFKSPNYDLVKEFINKEHPEDYDFKLENKVLKEEKDALLRELKFKKTPDGFDPDCSELSMSLQCVLLETYTKEKNIIVKGYYGRTIVIFNNGKYEMLETDTINSFWTLYKRTLMTTVPEYNKKCNGLHIKGSLKDNLEKVMDNIKEGGILDIKHYNAELTDEINKFAYLNHSIGNFMVGPSGFNCKDKYSKAKLYPPTNKGWSSFDRIDLFLSSLECLPREDWYEWFSRNMYLLDMEMYFENMKLVSDESEAINLRESKFINDLDEEDILKRIKKINELIKTRGKKMIERIRMFMEI